MIEKRGLEALRVEQERAAKLAEEARALTKKTAEMVEQSRASIRESWRLMASVSETGAASSASDQP